MITLHEIHKSYHMGEQDLHVLRGISFTINAGEYVAIMGPSGSGKSTLMNIVGCLDVADSGEYRLGNELVADMSDDQLAQLRNKQIGFVFQAFNLIPRLPALRQVSLPLMYAGVSRAEREARAVQMLEMVGLGDRMDHRPDQLSGGQQQRVAIARALGMSPTLLLADEPTGNLDTASGLEIMALFKKLNEEGKTIIMITHEHEIADQTRRKIQLRDGIILSDTENGHHKQAKSKH